MFSAIMSKVGSKMVEMSTPKSNVTVVEETPTEVTQSTTESLAIKAGELTSATITKSTELAKTSLEMTGKFAGRFASFAKKFSDEAVAGFKQGYQK